MAENISSESATAALLSGMRVIAQKAFGSQDCLKYDKETTDQLIAEAKKIRKTQPKWRTPSDFGGADGVWMSMVKERREVETLQVTSTRRIRVLRNHAIFLRRHDAMSRSDCETKTDARLEQYHRVYDEDGDPQTQPLVSTQLDACLVGDGGSVRINYKNPKDPRKRGVWSDTVEIRPLRVAMLVDTEVPWLCDAQTVGFLCAVRVERDLFRGLEAKGWVDKIPIGCTWTYVNGSPFDMRNKLRPLKSDSIATLVKARAAAGGLKTQKESDGYNQKDTEAALSGHFLRGHAGSVAYTLAVHEGAGWDPMLGVDRARHTLASFQKNYSRGVAPRLVAVFRLHKKKGQLRFEEAARL